MSTAPAAKPKKRRWRAKIVLLSISLGIALLFGEAVLRAKDGYGLFSLRLQHVMAGGDAAGQLAFNREWIDPFVEQLAGEREDLDPDWLATSPAPLPPQPKLDKPLLDQQLWLFHYYLTNEALLRNFWVKGQGLPMFPGLEMPDEFTVFSPPGGKITPRYRYPASRELPSGLTTNAFGFRGRQLEVDKPEKTIRIAFVGASTTVEMAALPHSAPELIEHWLNLWAQTQGLAVRFETLNAAREAIQSHDIRAIVEDELLPLAVDYVVYYEGANQLQPSHLLPHVAIEGEYQLSTPPPGLIGIFDGTESAETTWLDRLSSFSAIARNLRSIGRDSQPLTEPAKPTQTVVLAEGLDQDPFPLERAAELLQLGAIGTDLDAIQRALTSIDAQLVMCTFSWLAYDGLAVDPVFGHNIHVQLNRAYWPFRYETIERLAALQNRFYRAFAQQHGLDVIDIAGLLPRDERLYLDAIHQTELGVRLKAWLLFASLTTIVSRDLESGRVPVPDTNPDASHPNIGTERSLIREQLDGGR